MAEVLAQSKIIIELSDPTEIEAFAELLTEVKDVYIPKNRVGFQMHPKYIVKENIGELCVNLYELFFGTEALNEHIDNEIIEEE